MGPREEDCKVKVGTHEGCLCGAPHGKLQEQPGEGLGEGNEQFALGTKYKKVLKSTGIKILNILMHCCFF